MVCDNEADQSSEAVSLKLADFPLHTHEWRVAFLRELYMQGYPSLLAGVSRAWALMERPKAARCTYVGILAGTGGKGKKALFNFMRAMIQEALAIGQPIPRIDNHPSLEAWNRAVYEQWANEHHATELVIEKYAYLLVGRTAPERELPGIVLVGPWHPTVNSDEQRQ